MTTTPVKLLIGVFLAGMLALGIGVGYLVDDGPGIGTQMTRAHMIGMEMDSADMEMHSSSQMAAMPGGMHGMPMVHEGVSMDHDAMDHDAMGHDAMGDMSPARHHRSGGGTSKHGHGS